MNKWVVQIYHNSCLRLADNLRSRYTQPIAQWLVSRAEQIDRVTPELVIQAIKDGVWRIIINGAIVCLLLTIAIASGYLKFQLPQPQEQDILLSFGAVGFNVFLTQSLNFQKLTSIIFFIIGLVSAIVLAHFVPMMHSVLMYLYTSWLLLFIVPICYWLTIAAFDLPKFRNSLTIVATLAAMVMYSMAAMIQVTDWQIGVDLLSIANHFSLYTVIGCLIIFIIFGSLAKLLQTSLKLSILSIRAAANQLRIDLKSGS